MQFGPYDSMYSYISMNYINAPHFQKMAYMPIMSFELYNIELVSLFNVSCNKNTGMDGPIKNLVGGTVV